MLPARRNARRWAEQCCTGQVVAGAGTVFLVVSGPPGSGKSTLALRLSEALGLPLLAKDTVKEALMSELSVPDVATSERLGRASMHVLFALAAHARQGAVLEANFHRSLARHDLFALPGSVLEVFCRCSPHTAADRFRRRVSERHPGHRDDEREAASLFSDEVARPIGGGWPVIEVDTEDEVPEDVIEAICTTVVALARRSVPDDEDGESDVAEDDEIARPPLETGEEKNENKDGECHRSVPAGDEDR